MRGLPRHAVLEGLPAAGKSEVLELLARFYSDKVRVFPELVKEVAIREGISLFAERERLTEALLREAPRRRSRLEEALGRGFLCLEESHLGVHLAYSQALGDASLLAAWPDLERSLVNPDLYLRMEIPVGVSSRRQAARGTPQFEVQEMTLRAMLAHLDTWHAERRTTLRLVDADRTASACLAEIEGLLDLRPEEGSPPDAFDVLFLLGRPASGKSEMIDFLRRTPLERRLERYGIGGFDVVDDFPLLWSACEDDDLQERLGQGRRYSRRADGNYAVADPSLWALLTARLDALVRMAPSGRRTSVVEFSRGGRRGYADALGAFSPEVLSRGAILYVSVSYAESCRRNLARYDAGRRSGILTHSVPREEMEATYATDDWSLLTGEAREGTICVSGHRVPFATLPNEPESTDPTILDARYHDALQRLYSRWRSR